MLLLVSDPDSAIAISMWLVNVSDNLGRKAHFKKYLPYNGKWQFSSSPFFSVAEVNSRPKPELVLINGKPIRRANGSLFQQWRENGKRRTLPVGTSPLAEKKASIKRRSTIA